MARKRPVPHAPPVVPGPVAFSPLRLFVVSDLEPLWRAASADAMPPVDDAAIAELVRILNDGLTAYVVQARRERFATAGDAVKWDNNVSTMARELLAALGVRPIHESRSLADRPPMEDELPAEIVFALASEDTAPEWRDHLGLPATFNAAVRHSIGAVWWLARAAEAAEKMHDVEKKRGAASRRKREATLGSRERLVLHLAQAFERLSGEKVPKTPHAADTPHPFNRWCLASFGIAAERIDEVARRMADAAYPLQPDDIDAVKALTDVKASSIRDDMRNHVHGRLNRKRP